MKMFSKNPSASFLAIILFGLGFTLPTLVFAAGPPAPNLGTSGNFRILAETGVSDGNPTVTSVVGNIGVSPASGSSITGISCTNVAGNIYDVDGTYTGGFDSNTSCFLPGPGANKTTVDNAVGDMETAYTAASAPATPAGVGASNLNVGGGTLSGENFVPGTYTWGTNVTIPGNITLTGSASDVWVFQVNGTLGISTNTKIILAGGALPANIFWQTTGAVTLQPGSDFSGNILSQTSIAMQALATLHGRALAQSGVTLIGNTVTSVAPAPVVIAPTVITNSASSITETTATLNGAITATGGSDATQSGFAYGTTSDLSTVIATSTLGAQTGTASFTQDITGLSPSTTYYDRAYALNSAGTGFGVIQTFTTSAAPVTPAPTPAPVSNSGGGHSSGGTSPIFDPSVTSNSPVLTTTVTTVTTAHPAAGSIVPGLPNTGFPPEQQNTSSGSDIFIIAAAVILVSTSAVLVLKKSKV